MTTDPLAEPKEGPGAGLGPGPGRGAGGPWLGVDLGDVRIGVAISDPGLILATPLQTIERSGRGARAVAQELAGLASAHGARRVVIGYPLNMNGSVGDKAAAAAELAATLGAVLDSTHQGLGADVVLQDERRTTVQAAAQLRSAGRKAKAQRRVIDQAAAVVILQAAIDSPH